MSDQTRHQSDEFRLHEYLDGTLDTKDRRELETHLADCSHCSNKLDELSALFGALEELPDLHLMRDFTAPVLKAIRPPIKVSLTLRIMASVQAVIALILIVLAWPSLAIEEQLSQALMAGEHFLSKFAENISQIPALLATLQSRLFESVPQRLEFVLPEIPISISTYPAMGLWLLIGSVALLWLVGNRALLYPLFHNQPSNTNHT